MKKNLTKFLSLLVVLFAVAFSTGKAEGKYYIVFNNLWPVVNLEGGGTLMEYMYYWPFLAETKTKDYVVQAPFSAATFNQKDITEYDVAIFPMGEYPLSAAADGIKIWDKITQMLNAQKSVIIIGRSWLHYAFKGSDTDIKNYFQNVVGIDYSAPTSLMNGNTYQRLLLNAIDNKPGSGWTKQCNIIYGENGVSPVPPFFWYPEFTAFKFRMNPKGKGLEKVDTVGNDAYSDLWAGGYYENDKARLVFWSVDFEIASKIHSDYFRKNLTDAALWCVRDYPTPGPNIATNQLTLDFDNVQPTKTKTLPFEFQNYGREPLVINSFAIDDDEGVFKITEGGEPITLNPMDIHIVNVAFTPKDEIEYSASMTIKSNSVNGVYVLDMTGKGGDEVVNGPKFSVTRYPIEFGQIPYADKSIKNVQLSNIGNQALIVNTVEMFYNPSKNFTWEGQLKTPITIPAGKSAYIPVRYTASKEAGGLDTARIAFLTNGLNNGGVDTVLLVAKNMPKGTTAGISLSATSFDLGNVEPNTDKDFSLTISNKGSSNISVFTCKFDGDPENLEQFIFIDDCNKGIPPISPGSSYELRMRFTPSEQKEYSINLKLLTNDQTTPNYVLPITGSGKTGGYVEDGTLKMNGEFELNCNPNPVVNHSNLNFLSLASVPQNLEISLMDITGKTLLDVYSGLVNPGSQNFDFNAESLPSGNYFVNVKFMNKISQLPIVIAK